MSFITLTQGKTTMPGIIPGYEYDISLRPELSGLRLTSLHQLPSEDKRGEGEEGKR
jgi:hypothetical protein